MVSWYVEPQSSIIRPMSFLEGVRPAETGDRPIAFSGRTERRLLTFGATILTTGTQSVAMQNDLGKPFLFITHGDILRAELPRPTQVALFLDNSRLLFVPGSFGHSLQRQEEDLAEDTRFIRRVLNLPDISQGLPRASEVTSALFQIMGKIRRPLGNLMIRTGTQTHEHDDEEGFRTAVVQYFRGDKDGPASLGIHGFPADSGRENIGVLRWIVPSEASQLGESLTPNH
ncbi:MAG: hypothetical protein UU45_C0006G0007 [Candidatus Levybacteria bacterium GW2011_GWA2_41_15]|nr:MAG: hypothetical protein UU45_C0006G0007 [Candidatus Levybacteria bacterium GW2011_GWA2_41_15]